MSDNEKSAETSGRFPPWLRKRVRHDETAAGLIRLLEELDLATVCHGAHCPNLPECYARGSAAFMILGDRCTRDCGFCAVPGGQVRRVRDDEPQAVAEACEKLKLRHVVVTSVTRDDLPDGGAGHFARTIAAVKQRLPQTAVEVLTPDFQGDRGAIRTVLAARPDIFNHNVETVPRLYGLARAQADYRRSLEVLAAASELAAEMGITLYTKSGLMVGLGERPEEVTGVMRDLRRVGCDILTIGQYLAPSAGHVRVASYVRPAEFAAWQAEAKSLGFTAVAAGPFVRSSYHAEDLLEGVAR